jgi:hypothetical protein
MSASGFGELELLGVVQEKKRCGSDHEPDPDVSREAEKGECES